VVAKKVLPARETPAVPLAAAPAPAPGKPRAAKKTVSPESIAGTVAKSLLGLPPVATIVAKIDIGWGNQLFVRGEGGGLSWEKGTPMTCTGTNEWVWISAPHVASHTFKIVLNDIFWEQGDNHGAVLGETIVLTPLF
jgi:hypothetical protein